MYQICINEESPIHVISYIKEHEMPYNNEHFVLLKKNITNIYNILQSRAKQLYDDIMSKYEYIDRCPIIEICRHICDTLDTAKNISETYKISHNYTSHKYTCHKCNVCCNDEYHWIRHQLTKTHIDKITKNISLECECCNKYFFSRTSLWRHKKTCFEKADNISISIQRHTIIDDDISNSINNQSPSLSAIKQDIIDEITENIQEKIIELHKASIINNTTNNNTKCNYTNNNTTNNNNITNNNHFNLNFFLNETCKNAITIKEFIENIHVGVDTVEYTGRNGYVAGISKIITDELKKLGLHTRPIHCTDMKRETMYIKDENGWERDNEEKEKLNKTIRSVVRKNMREINQWRAENPNCDVNDSEEYNLDLNIMKECNGSNFEKTEHKRICSIIAKNTGVK